MPAPLGCSRRALDAGEPAAWGSELPSIRRELPSEDPRAEIAIAARTSESPADAAYLLDAEGRFWFSARCERGPATLRISAAVGKLVVECWGPGAEELDASVAHLIGREDTAARDFTPPPELLEALRRSSLSPLSWRVGANRQPYPTLLSIVVAQRVTGKEAYRSYRGLVRRYGERGPGPAPTWIAPQPPVVRRLDGEDFMACGIDSRRAHAMRGAARAQRLLRQLSQCDRTAAYRRLLSIEGIGEWSAAKLMLCSFGDGDAVWIKDAHLSDTVAWNLSGQARADDETLLRLLAPYRGHRGRVARLLELYGRPTPRFGPRRALSPHR